MGIKYFYNFTVAQRDNTDLSGDILSAVRKSYFDEFDKIRDRITVDSEGSSLSYDYCIEKDRPLRWTVRDADGTVLQDAQPAPEGAYYICFYREHTLFKRLFFSGRHTLLKAEYMSENGAVCCAIEPRKYMGGLCLRYTDDRLTEPLVLSAAPGFRDMEPRLAEKLLEHFADYTAVASTNDGIIWFLSDEQMERYQRFVAAAEEELREQPEERFVDETPLYDKINAKDFNVKRNLSSALDISEAQEFGTPKAEEAEVPAESVDMTEGDTAGDADTAELRQEGEEAEGAVAAAGPDKLIMADGAVYSYYGELDESGNRSGYGRTLTDFGRTAYEGEYRGDKRSGKGAYFYKDGTLCYSGDWAENARHGVGVGVSARDGSIHVGRWVNNKPEGNGVRLSSNGEIRFVCQELADGGTALLQYHPDDTVLIARYDRDGKKIGEKTVSLLDF